MRPMQMDQTRRPPMLDSLIAFGDLKVWSVLVTIFGDLAPGEGERIDGPVLSALMARIGIKPEAVRVALHRLRNDGWIVSEKSGRVSAYGLSAVARSETQAVRDHIYAPYVPGFDRWFLIVLPGDAPDVVASNWIAIGRRMFVSADKPTDAQEGMITEFAPSAVPDWMRERVVSKDVQHAFQDLLRILPARPNLDGSALDHAVLRMMILHNWRRQVLRITPAAASFMGADWAGARCRRAAHECLKAMPAVAPCDLHSLLA